MARLEGRTAIVTGGAVGIGRHYSQALAAAGAQVMIADIKDGSALAAELAAKHGRNSTDSITFDVSDEALVAAAPDAVEAILDFYYPDGRHRSDFLVARWRLQLIAEFSVGVLIRAPVHRQDAGLTRLGEYVNASR